MSEAAASEAGDPLDMTGAQRVQEGRDSKSERGVFRRDGLYFKREIRIAPFLAAAASRFFPPAREEFKSILLLRRCGIPVVEPVGFGSDGRASILITREEKGTVTVREQLRRFEEAGEVPSDEFLTGWCEVAGALFRNRIYFPDFHNGNVLCRGSSGGFVIVDPQGVRRSFVDHENRRMKMLRRQYGEFFGAVPGRTVRKMLAVIAPEEDTERLYRRLMLHSAAYIREHSLRKRRRLEKFRAGACTLRSGGIEYRLGSAGKALTPEGTEAVDLPADRAQALWERDYLLTLFQLPRLRIVARDMRRGTLYREAAAPGEPSETLRRDLLERVELAGFDPREFGCRFDLRGREVLLDNGPLA